MRRVILLLLVVLLPLNGWAAAASLCCAHQAAGGHATHAGHATHDGHAAHDGHATHDGHAMHDGPAEGDALAAHAEAAGDPDCVHADCGACCHATGSAAFGVTRLPWTGPAAAFVPVGVVAASPDSPALDGPFRPPRTASA